MKKVYFKLSILFIAISTVQSCATSENAPSKTAPTVTTATISNVTLNSASSGGNVTNDGEDTVTARGIVWNTATSPTISLNTKTNDGTGTGNFSSSITNLIPSSTYFVRAYATNSIGTAYGNELSFTTGAIVLPTLSTTAITNVTTNSAVSGGNITSDGGAPITARGIVWSESWSPTISLATKTTDGIGKGAFTSAISGLSHSRTYFVRAYATNSAGTNYGGEIQFTTNATPKVTSVTDIDGNVYPLTVDANFCITSGGTWYCSQTFYSTKNLNVSKYTDGTVIPQITDPTDWINSKTGAWCYYNNDSANGATYGKLYNWYAVMGIYDTASLTNPSLRKQLAPKGYHIPTFDEFNTLTKYVYATKEGGTAHWLSPNTGGNTDTSLYSFRLLPGGYRDQDGRFGAMNSYGMWWSSTQLISETSFKLVAKYDISIPGVGTDYKFNGLSVIFIQD